MSAAIEVGLGLAFMYFVFATFCSGVNEAIARFLNSRGKALFAAINGLIDDGELAQNFWKDKLVVSLAKAKSPRNRSGEAKIGMRTKAGPPDQRGAIWPHKPDAEIVKLSDDKKVLPNTIKRTQARALPSYIAPKTFAAALVNTYKTTTQPRGASPLDESASLVDRLLREAIVKSDASSGKTAQEVAAAAPVTTPIGAELIDAHLEPIIDHLATWFNDAMDRLSGMYKRRVQLWLLGISVVVVGAFNLNTVHVAQELWRNPTLRAQISSQAQSASATTTATAACPAGATGNPTSVSCAITDAQDLPVGWGKPNQPSRWDFGGVFWALLGWVLSLLALSLGAPFWFSVMTKLSSLRSTGPPPSGASSST